MRYSFLLTCLPAAPLYLYFAMAGDYPMAALSLLLFYGTWDFSVWLSMQPEVVR
jgi:hypothetical protein